MKKFIVVAALMVLFCGTALSAKSFDWSECWCNYGGGLEKGDFVVNVDTGFVFNDFSRAASYGSFWFVPPVIVEVQYVQPIWKLPFTFGGYAGLHAYGYEYYDAKAKENKTAKNIWAFFGGEAAYHIQLPPEQLDLYASTRIGGSVPFVSHGSVSPADCFHVGGAMGANWFFTDFFGVNLEFGYPFSKFGVTFKF